MHVRKFYGETIEETLKKIKTELGPDTIILKTVSNKGVKGALKKHKIEITAAISEKDYVKKALNLCKDLEKVKSLKKNLREIAIKSSLFDSKGFADSFYKKLNNLWTNYRK